MLREDNRAVFAEQGASTSQMAAAKFFDTVSKLLGMAGKTSDAITAYTLLRLAKEECPEIRVRISPRQSPHSGDKIDDLVVLLERNLFGHPLAGLLCERRFEDVLFEKGREKSTKLGLFLPVYVDDICTHTHLLHAHFSGVHTLRVHFAHSCACYTHAWLKGVCSTHVVISLSSHLLLSHVSPVLAPLLFLDGQLKTTPDCDLIDIDVRVFLPNFPNLKAQVKRTPHEDEEFGFLAKSAQSVTIAKRRMA